MQNRHLPPLLRFFPQFAQICIIFALCKFEANPFFRPVQHHHHDHHHHISIVFFPPPPPPPHFYCFLSSTNTTTTATTTTFLLFSVHQYHHHHRYHRHHISIVFPPPPPPPHFYCFPSTRFYKRLPNAILSSFCNNVSCSEQQSWFSSAVSIFPRLSAPVSFKDSYTTATSCTSPSLIQFTHGTHSCLRRK